MNKETQNHKITPEHLQRKAVVYLRQSSPRQVRENLESQRLQYGLLDHAQALGWRDIEPLDTDLGMSASIGSARREGFDRLTAAVARGEIGIIMARELTRLSRTDKDWCQLMEVCQVFNTLLGDDEHIYDLALQDDLLLLGIKGTLSVIEIKVLKKRMLDGQEEKARRGELMRLLPPGYVTGADGKVVKDPDLRIQESVSSVFRVFRDTWSVRQTFKWFHDHEVELPVNKHRGGRWHRVWQAPSQSYVPNMLGNAFYAGAYAYGQRVMETVFVAGRLKKRVGRFRKPHECRVFIRDHHERYIDWETFEENQRMIQGNAVKDGREETRAAIRGGRGLLTGLLRCGRCGRRLYVSYDRRDGGSLRYLCKGAYDQGGEYCLGFGGVTLDRRLSEEILKVISPLGITASLEALDTFDAARQERRQALARHLQQLEHEARRAGEQFDEVDARNRLVAAELESRWNQKRDEVRRLKEEVERVERETHTLSETDREKVLQMGRDFANVWNSPHCPIELKKKIARTIIEEIIANQDRSTGRLSLVIHWKGGTHTSLEVKMPPPGAEQKTVAEDLEIVRRMAPRYGDDQIAAVLNRLGRKTGKGRRWNRVSVRTVRRNYSIGGTGNRVIDPEVLNMEQAAKECGVCTATIRKLVALGILRKEQVAPFAPWELQRSELESEPVRTILETLRTTGKLVLDGDVSSRQGKLFQ